MTANGWPEVTLEVHPGVGHFLTEKQSSEVVAWIVATAKGLRAR